MQIRIIDKAISRGGISEMAMEQFGDMIKAVVDVEKKIMAVGGELHSDEETLLLDNGSRQDDLWGINLYPQRNGSDWIEFDSMINLRPWAGNRTRSVDDPATREKIIEIVESLVIEP